MSSLPVRPTGTFADERLIERIKVIAGDPHTDPRVKKKNMQVLGSWYIQFKDDPRMRTVAGLYKACGGGGSGGAAAKQVSSHLFTRSRDDFSRLAIPLRMFCESDTCKRTADPCPRQVSRTDATAAYEAQQERYEREAALRAERKAAERRAREAAEERAAQEKLEKARRKEAERARAAGGAKVKRPKFNFELVSLEHCLSPVVARVRAQCTCPRAGKAENHDGSGCWRASCASVSFLGGLLPVRALLVI